MKYLIVICLFVCFVQVKGQTGHFNDFNDLTGWTAGTGYTLTNPGNVEMQAAGAAVGTSYQTFQYGFTALDLTVYPFVQVKMRTPNANCKVRIDLADATGKVTNAIPTTVTVSGNTYTWFTFDFTGKFTQSFPAAGTVDPAQINRLLVYYQPGGPNYTGSVFFDSLRIGSECDIPEPPKDIRLNQLGFYPDAPKLAIAVQPENTTFYIVSQNKQDTLYTGTLGASAVWSHSGETVRKANFSDFTDVGTFYITLDSGYSLPFKIEPKVHIGVTKGLLKSFYFNRASMAIAAPWAESWARPKAHADQVVYVHSSAASPGRPEGTTFASPRGWYDAGDYNKYMVNSGISTYTVLAMYEHYPAFFDTLNTFIPESSNAIPDVLDEALYNLRWMLTAQDPTDGGVYHKVTDANFSGTVMPHSYSSTRYGVQRSTAGTLDFAAVMAQAYRIFKNFETELPEFADSCLAASLNAYNWALANPNVIVDPNAANGGNPAGIGTGTYANSNVNDEFAWARMELYAATRNDMYYDRPSVVSGTFGIPGWADVNTLGLVTLVHNRRQLNTAGYADTATIKNKLINAAVTYKNHAPNSAYGTAMGQAAWQFQWGSNAVAGNMGLVMLQAYKLTGDVNYFNAALTNLDYVLGRNGTGYSFVTGYGSKSPMAPHHRISQADAVANPVPGMVVGGANPGQQDGCVGYPSSLPGRSYVDTYCSHASNEPAINYTAPVAYLAGAIEAIKAGAIYTPPYSAPPLTGINKSKASISAKVYPNPSKGEVTIEFENKGTAKISITDVAGKTVVEETIHTLNFVTTTLNIEDLPQGIYMISISNDEGVAMKKIVKQ